MVGRRERRKPRNEAWGREVEREREWLKEKCGVKRGRRPRGFGEGARDRTLGLLAPLCVLLGDNMTVADTQ